MALLGQSQGGEACEPGSLLTSLVMQLHVLLVRFTYIDMQQGPGAAVRLGLSGWLCSTFHRITSS